MHRQRACSLAQTVALGARPWLGAGWWALDVQAHQDADQSAIGAVHLDQYLNPTFYAWTTSPIPPGGNQYRFHRENGQLLFMYVPGS